MVPRPRLPRGAGNASRLRRDRRSLGRGFRSGLRCGGLCKGWTRERPRPRCIGDLRHGAALRASRRCRGCRPIGRRMGDGRLRQQAASEGRGDGEHGGRSRWPSTATGKSQLQAGRTGACRGTSTAPPPRRRCSGCSPPTTASLRRRSQRRCTRRLSSSGGKADLVQLGPFGTDGHSLFFGRGGSAIWGPLVEKYLAARARGG